MKKNLFLFVILLLSHKFITTADDCSSSFVDILKSKCSTFLNFATPSKICYYYNNQCIDWYTECSDYSPNDSSFNDNICKEITLSGKDNKKCIVTTESNNKVCKEVYKECKDLTISNCLSAEINLETDERCVFNNYMCELHYEHCNHDAIKTDRTKCNNNIPYDTKKKCFWDGSTCQEINKECKDLTISNCLSAEINLETDERCVFNNYMCELHYEHCNHDAIKTDRTKCNNNIPDDPKKKCSWDGSTCQEIDKECKDLTKEQCLILTLNLKENERCVLINDKCESHFSTCTNTEINSDETKCKNNIPSEKSKKCKWNGSTCQVDDRKCGDFIIYSDNNGGNSKCYSLVHDEKKICYFDGSHCIETFAECSKYEGDDETFCNNIIPLKKTIDSDEGSYIVDKFNKCEMESNSCTEKPRVCSDYKKRSDDTGELCSQLQSEKDPNKVKAQCILEGETCKDRYLKCENYNDLVTDETKRTEAECNLALADQYHKCTFKSDDHNQCITEKKKCEEINDPTICNAHVLDDTEKKCIFKNNLCKEEFKNCDIYKTHHSADLTRINRDECESITPIYVGDNKKYKCIYKDESGSKTCEKKLVECEEYEGNIESECKALSSSTNDTTLFSCKFINNKCVTQYIDCGTYNYNQINNNKLVDKKTCESIVFENDPFYKCYYQKDKYCWEGPKLCSEYLGEDETICSQYGSLNSNKRCTIENKKCVEKYKPEVYQYCSDYRGTSKDICESIQPYNHDTTPTPDFSSRCEFKNNECVRISKKCEEAKNENECGAIQLTNTDKECVFTNDKCIEQYKTCSKYNAITGPLDSNTCQSIIIKESEKYFTKKCVYTEGAGDTRTCAEETRGCSDFKIEFYRSECSRITPIDQTKKCSFFNNACSSVDKTCLELNRLSNPTSETCGKAATSSSDKMCVVNDSNNGCKEVDRPKNQDTETNSEEKSFGGKINLNVIIFIAFCLLV